MFQLILLIINRLNFSLHEPGGIYLGRKVNITSLSIFVEHSVHHFVPGEYPSVSFPTASKTGWSLLGISCFLMHREWDARGAKHLLFCRLTSSQWTRQTNVPTGEFSCPCHVQRQFVMTASTFASTASFYCTFLASRETTQQQQHETQNSSP